MKKILLTLLMTLSLAIFMASCKLPSSSSSRSSNSGSGGGNTGTTPDPETPAPEFKLTNISIPETVSQSSEVLVSAELEGETSEVILFQFLSSNGKNHMVPSSGIIATNQNAGQINFTYNAPPQTGKHYYYFKVFNSAGQEIEQQFNITVVD